MLACAILTTCSCIFIPYDVLKLSEFLSSLKEIEMIIQHRLQNSRRFLSKGRNTLELAVRRNEKRRLLPSKWSTSVCHILSEEHLKQAKQDKRRLLNGYFLSTPGRTYPSTDALGWRITNLFLYEACITPQGHSQEGRMWPDIAFCSVRTTFPWFPTRVLTPGASEFDWKYVTCFGTKFQSTCYKLCLKSLEIAHQFIAYGIVLHMAMSEQK